MKRLVNIVAAILAIMLMFSACGKTEVDVAA